MKYFKNVKSSEDLKRQYKVLCKKYHPDLNPDTDTNAIMAEINNEYSELFKKYKNIHENSEGETYTAKEETKEQSEDFINIINSIINFNIDIEIIGSWVWCFNSYEYRTQLKELGFKYSAKKKAWCWHSGEYKRRSKRNISIDEIRNKYGSDTIREKEELDKLAYA